MSQAATPPGSPWSSRRILAIVLAAGRGPGGLAGYLGHHALVAAGDHAAVAPGGQGRARRRQAEGRRRPTAPTDSRRPRNSTAAPPGSTPPARSASRTCAARSSSSTSGPSAASTASTRCPTWPSSKRSTPTSSSSSASTRPSSTTRRTASSIRKAILRYEISHPVVNDSQMQDLEQATASDSWPTLVPDRPGGQQSSATATGEGNYELLDTRHRPSSSPSTARRRRSTRSRSSSSWPASRRRATARSSSPARCWPTPPSKRLFIADSTHHRIVITDLDGKKIAIAGTGEPGKADGAFDKATFNDPQGMALKATRSTSPTARTT